MQILDTIAEIQERHDAVRDIEKKLLELHQVTRYLSLIRRVGNKQLRTHFHLLEMKFCNFATLCFCFGCKTLTKRHLLKWAMVDEHYRFFWIWQCSLKHKASSLTTLKLRFCDIFLKVILYYVPQIPDTLRESSKLAARLR